MKVYGKPRFTYREHSVIGFTLLDKDNHIIGRLGYFVKKRRVSGIEKNRAWKKAERRFSFSSDE